MNKDNNINYMNLNNTNTKDSSCYGKNNEDILKKFESIINKLKYYKDSCNRLKTTEVVH